MRGTPGRRADPLPLRAVGIHIGTAPAPADPLVA
jgi:hypothetical protein